MKHLVVVKCYTVYSNRFNRGCYNTKSIDGMFHEMKVGKLDYLLLSSGEDESPRPQESRRQLHKNDSGIIELMNVFCHVSKGHT